MRSFKKNSDYQTKRLTLRFECILEFLCNFWSLVPLSLILIHAARRHFGTPLTLQKTLSKERVLPKDTKYVIGMKTQKFTPTCFKTFYFSLFFFFPPLTPHLPISSLLPLHSVSLFSNCCIYLLKPTHPHGCAYQQEGSEPSSHSGRFCRHPGLWRHGPAGPEGRGPSRSPSSCQRGPEPVLQHDANRTQEIISTRSWNKKRL